MSFLFPYGLRITTGAVPSSLVHSFPNAQEIGEDLRPTCAVYSEKLQYKYSVEVAERRKVAAREGAFDLVAAK